MSSIIERLAAAVVIPVVRVDDAGVAIRACELLVDEGIRALEVTMTVPGAPGLVSRLRTSMPSVLIGAGTILGLRDADAVVEAGAEFIVSPCWSDVVADRVIGAGVPYLPGAMTPGEVLHHARSGAAVVKIFPADAVGGPLFLKALRAVLPDVALMPTGGITPESVQAFRAAGALCVGMGDHLLPARALEAGDVKTARAQVRAALKQMQYNSVHKED